MFKIFRIAFSLKNTYRVNTILFSLKQIPLVKRLLPLRLYQSRGLKRLGLVLSIFWEIAGALLGKLLYLLLMVVWAGNLYGKENGTEIYAHLLFFLTLIGAYMNTYLFNPTNDKYYAMILMRMDARKYTLTDYGYTLLRTGLSFLPALLWISFSRGLPLWVCLLAPLHILSVKLAAAGLFLRRYEKTGVCSNENLPPGLAWGLTGILLGAAYALPALGLCMPLPLYGALALFSLVPGIFGIVKIAGFAEYRAMYQMLLAQKRCAVDVKQSVQTAVLEQNRKNISKEGGMTTQKEGFAGFQELFMKRHRKILWKSAKRMAGILAAASLGAAGASLISREAAFALNGLLLRALPWFAFIMYTVNRGTAFTQALFMNCDRSMLTYSFYKKPAFILRLFRLRLLGIIGVNLLPAGVLAAGMPLILYLSGGTGQVLYYLLYPASILAMSVFFSVHYLTLYYLLQPYTASTELKSGTYRLAVWATYLVCFLLLQVEVPPLLFGLLSVVFCLGYCGAACALVYRLAGRTFRIRY